MPSFTQIPVWKPAMLLMKRIYDVTRKFPRDEKFEMVSQMRRASTSILANLAEGYSRTGRADKANRYTISRGECSEIHAFILISCELQYIDQAEAQELLDLTETIGRMLSGLIRYYSKE